jgi:hypothetical protein
MGLVDFLLRVLEVAVFIFIIYSFIIEVLKPNK